MAITFIMVMFAGKVTADPASHRVPVYFELRESAIGHSGLPDSRWIRSLFPARDGSEEQVEVEPLHCVRKGEGAGLFDRVFVIQSEDVDLSNQLLTRLRSDRDVLWAEVPPERHTDDYRDQGNDEIDSPANDPFYSLQWGLDKIHAPAAWDLSQGSPEIIIAVIDIGTDIGHGDLIQQLWVNQSEQNGVAGVDDDDNGYIDDRNGWDFYDDDPDPRPRSGDNHGTHVAGIACAATNNRYGVAGVSYNCSLMAIRAGVGPVITYGFEGLIYAVENGADIINLSWGGGDFSHIERIAIEYALTRGVLVVAAAGNLTGPSNFDHYPAAYDEAFAVGSTDDHDKKSDFGNYASWIDISAPGSSIFSLFANQGYGIEDGTSMACPMVAGAAGLLKAVYPDWKPVQLRTQLEVSCDDIDRLNTAFSGRIGKGRLNLYRALADARPKIVLDSILISEPGGDGIIDPGDRIQLAFRLFNPSRRTAKFSLGVRSQSGQLFVDNTLVDSLEVEPNEFLSTEDQTILARISANADDSIEFKCNLEIVPETGTSYLIPFILAVRKQYETIKNDRVALTIGDMGSLGYYDYRNNMGYGEGFRYPVDGLSSLFHGSFMVGASGNRVSDNSYGNLEQNRYDFIPLHPGVARSEIGSTRVLKTHYSDENADTVIGIEIEQATMVSMDTEDRTFVVLEYKLSLLPVFSTVDSLYAGMYLDWDIQTATDNYYDWDSETQFGYMQPSPTHFGGGSRPTFGVGLVNQPASYYAGVNRSDIRRSWSDEDKSNILRSGEFAHSGEAPDDWAQLIGAGPFQLVPGDSIILTFALVGGANLGMAEAGLRSARSWYGDVRTSSQLLLPNDFGIFSAYPNPFNGFTTLNFRLPLGTNYNWSLYDIAGREELGGSGVVNRSSLIPVQIDGSILPSGTYLMQLQSSGKVYTRSITLLR